MFNKIIILVLIALCFVSQTRAGCTATVNAGDTLWNLYAQHCSDASAAYARGCSNFDCNNIYPGMAIVMPGDLCNC